MLGNVDQIPAPGDVVRARARTHLVEDVEGAAQDPMGVLVRLACLDDDAQGEPTEAVWGLELDTEILDRDVWQAIGGRGFDDPGRFAAYLHTLR